VAPPVAAEPEGRTPFPASRVLGFGLPLVLGMGGHALFNLADLWIVGVLGPAAITAVFVASMVNTVAMVVVQGIAEGSVALVARAIGAGDLPRAAEAGRQAILLCLVLGVLLGLLPWWAAGPLVDLFGVPPDARELSVRCLEIPPSGA
jgi:Na+-driven multidrug efflux pump